MSKWHLPSQHQPWCVTKNNKYKYEYIYSNGLYPVTYWLVTNQPQTEWLNTIIDYYHASVGWLEVGRNHLQLYVCRSTEDSTLTWDWVEQVRLGSSAPSSFQEQWVNTGVSYSWQWQRSKRSRNFEDLLDPGWNCHTINSGSFFCLKQVMWARVGEIELASIMGRTKKSHVKQHEYKEERELRPLICSITWAELLKSPNKKQFYFPPNIALKYALLNLPCPIPSLYLQFQLEQSHLGNEASLSGKNMFRTTILKFPSHIQFTASLLSGFLSQRPVVETGLIDMDGDFPEPTSRKDTLASCQEWTADRFSCQLLQGSLSCRGMPCLKPWGSCIP